MIKLMSIYSQIIQEALDRNFTNERENIMFEDSRLFQELADPNFAYKYNKIDNNTWEFKDKYSNTLGVYFDPSNRYLDSYYVVRNLDGKEIKMFDYESNKERIDPTSVQGGTDQNRSDTICKIIRDEIIPEYLLKSKPSIIKIHPLNEYRHRIFLKCAEICKEKYNFLSIKEIGNEIHIINK